jgi:hypothetical protein
MEKNEEAKKSCCSGSCGGCGCGKKVIGALVLVILGWICGFLMGSGGLCHKPKGAYPMSAMSCPMSPPAAPMK